MQTVYVSDKAIRAIEKLGRWHRCPLRVCPSFHKSPRRSWSFLYLKGNACNMINPPLTLGNQRSIDCTKIPEGHVEIERKKVSKWRDQKNKEGSILHSGDVFRAKTVRYLWEGHPSEFWCVLAFAILLVFVLETMFRWPLWRSRAVAKVRLNWIAVPLLYWS